ncbi:sideroflexin-2 isoform X1 [Nilaparvata lugens]|uniref:sideroflexin-2 isoform X1 n=1 Tax=Nilaparvata lugens TaxID=108931 RepID=UPI000B993B3C|nr:sideroflexin-2 isoform X1 [Nilaparvata lugens]XP_039281986.1 sideroflexin-2 isoform X1 [Nilaparvata lugens]
MSELPVQRWDFDAPLWDQCTFIGRVKYYAWITDPRLNFVSTSCFHQAKHLRTLYLEGKPPADVTAEKFYFSKQLYESAFHPDSGDLMNVFGRMSFQMPGGMLITGAMLTWYKSTTAVVFWQWANQSFNAFVNYTNRNANSPLTEKQMGIAYVSATAAACVTAIGFKKWLAKQASPLIQRYVPFAAVAAANCVNIPLMRQNEFLGGIDVFSDDGTKVGTSKLAAVKGISEVVLSRIIMCAPGMNIMPLIMKRMETRCWFRKATWFHAPFQTLMVGGFLTVMVPVACGIFPQKCGISTSMIERFEPEEYEKLKKFCKGKVPETVFFNKGL